jgi:DNA-directed RNA polymerase specialized sigma24 family protein
VRAAEKYELLRRKLVKFFQWRGAALPEEHADEAINRLSRRLEQGEAIQNIGSYSYGVARMLLKEVGKQAIRERVALEGMSLSEHEQPPDEALDSRRRCFDECLRAMTDESRALILKYYEGERQVKIQARKSLAERLAISTDALRIRAHRIRARLEMCVNDCLDQRPH